MLWFISSWSSHNWIKVTRNRIVEKIHKSQGIEKKNRYASNNAFISLFILSQNHRILHLQCGWISKLTHKFISRFFEENLYLCTIPKAWTNFIAVLSLSGYCQMVKFITVSVVNVTYNLIINISIRRNFKLTCFERLRLNNSNSKCLKIKISKS